MPPVPSVRGIQVAHALERLGFKVAQVNGSLHIMRHPDGRGKSLYIAAVIWQKVLFVAS
jgi:predicted RNA binding protein YcfA (HicA-like mRNA interferase family)